MFAYKGRAFGRPWLWCGALALCLLLCHVPARAQSAATDPDAPQSYRTREDTPPTETAQGAASAPADDKTGTNQQEAGPVRMVRFASISGNVTWRGGDGMDWSKATINLPLRQDAQVWVTDGGRAVLQFDDGSELRLGNGALVTMKLLYSDAKGEFTQITLTDGLATLRAKHDVSVYQIDTPLVSVKTAGPSQVRLGVDTGTEVAVQSGSASVDGAQGKTTLNAGNYLSLANGNAPYRATAIPSADSWDRWNTERNRLLDSDTETNRHVPDNIGQVAGNLDQYGTWHDDPKYGSVWAPTVSSPEWRPYEYGRWTWVEPYGWTWVSDEAWGWAPYHYGTWIDEPYGWAWCPGPAYQYWSPGVVDFSFYAGNVCWAPLCPWEVRYPAAFGIGFWGRHWGLSFSIGCAGVYYYGGFGYCVGRPFNTFYANRGGYGHFAGNYHDNFGHGNFGVTGQHFVPYNAGHVAGATYASTEAFGGRGSYHTLARGETTAFTRGQTNGLPVAGRGPLSGPGSVAPTRLSMTPTRSFVTNAHPSQAALARATYRASQSASSSVQRSASSASSARSSLGTGSGNRSGSGEFGRGNAASSGSAAYASRNGGGSNGRSMSAAEAAQQARASIGYSRSSGSGFGSSGSGRYGGYSSGGSYGSYGGRYGGYSSGGSYGGGYGGRSTSGSYGGQGGYHAGDYGGSRGGSSYGGGGGNYSGGSRGGTSSGGGGGSRGGGGGGRGR